MEAKQGNEDPIKDSDHISQITVKGDLAYFGLPYLENEYFTFFYDITSY